MNLSQLKDSIINISSTNQTRSIKLQLICDFLKKEISYYDWVGFYFKNGDKNGIC